ncbi:MAG TPA: amidohydrolase family protein [Gemmatimonadaceae bacterium]|nr:amidohydrolase family protein [Gemmatimonadaceae bacterium]
MTARWAVALLVLLVLLPATAAAQHRAVTYDIAILGGRVMDPASGLDAVRNVGIRADRIVTVTTARIAGRDTIDARGLVVAPGFIDLHAHGQDDEAYRYYVMDGVTTALELELGVGPIAAFYAAREGKALVNFGGSASHFQGRRIATGTQLRDYYHETWTDTSARFSQTRTTQPLIDTVQAYLRRELDAGALGVGIGVAYIPGATGLEIFRLFEICAERRVICFTHVRDALPGIQEVVGDAMATGASLHVVHANSSSGANLGASTWMPFLRVIHAARRHGVDVTTEAYPYTAGSTFVQSAIFDSWVTDTTSDYNSLVWVATGEHLTRETFLGYRRVGGNVIQLGAADSVLYPLFRDSMVMVASDAVPWFNHRGHPRLAGTFARVLGRFVREQQLFSLMEGLRRMTIMPARRLEASVPQMRTKGRLARGMDADIVVFDAARIIDRATYEEPARYSEGVVYVLVNGTTVVRAGTPVTTAFPGRAIRRRIHPPSKR